jgi:hypothetical protein
MVKHWAGFREKVGESEYLPRAAGSGTRSAERKYPSTKQYEWYEQCEQYEAFECGDVRLA